MRDMDPAQASMQRVGQHDHEIMLLHHAPIYLMSAPPPMLPGRGLQAGAFTAGELPEDERMVRIAQRDDLSQAARRQLTRGHPPGRGALHSCYGSTKCSVGRKWVVICAGRFYV